MTPLTFLNLYVGKTSFPNDFFIWRNIICQKRSAFFLFRKGRVRWVSLGMAVRGMGLGTCLAIHVTITDMCEMTLIKSATLNAIKI